MANFIWTNGANENEKETEVCGEWSAKASFSATEPNAGWTVRICKNGLLERSFTMQAEWRDVIDAADAELNKLDGAK